jgi:hypothetical protein
MESALGMLSKMSGNLRVSRLHLSRALFNATLVDDMGAEMRAMHQLGLLALAANNWNRAAMLFETADRQSQVIGVNRLGHLVLGGISRHLSGDEDLAKSHLDAANDIVSEDQVEAISVLTNIGNSLLAIDCPGLAIEILDEAMECAIESSQHDKLDMLAETLLLANTALNDNDIPQYEGLRQLLDGLNHISEEASEEFAAKISDIDQRASEFSKPLDETWNEWQDASRLIPSGSPLIVLRVDADEAGRNLIISHHSEIGAIGLWLPEGGVIAAPGNSIMVHDSRIKVAPPTDELRETHNIRGVVAVEDSSALTFTANTEDIVE